VVKDEEGERVSARRTRGAVSRGTPHFSLFRLVMWSVTLLAGAQALIAAMLAANRRRRFRPNEGFPHLMLPETTVGQNRLTIYSYGRDVYDAMLEAIRDARETVYIESFIWKDDEVGREFKKLLIRKSLEGVEVYVIFDSFGNFIVPSAFKVFPPSVHLMAYSAIRRPWHILDPRRYALDHRNCSL